MKDEEQDRLSEKDRGQDKVIQRDKKETGKQVKVKDKQK